MSLWPVCVKVLKLFCGSEYIAGKKGQAMDIINITIGTLVQGKKDLVEVKSSTSIYDTLRIVDENSVISCPLYEAPQSNTPGTMQFTFITAITMYFIVGLVAGGREFVAFVSISDILGYVLKESTVESVENVLDTRILEVVGSSKETMIHSVEAESEPLYVIMEKMTQGIYTPWNILRTY